MIEKRSFQSTEDFPDVEEVWHARMSRERHLLIHGFAKTKISSSVLAP